MVRIARRPMTWLDWVGRFWFAFSIWRCDAWGGGPIEWSLAWTVSLGLWNVRKGGRDETVSQDSDRVRS
jgi:hypothetical protein